MTLYRCRTRRRTRLSPTSPTSAASHWSRRHRRPRRRQRSRRLDTGTLPKNNGTAPPKAPPGPHRQGLPTSPRRHPQRRATHRRSERPIAGSITEPQAERRDVAPAFSSTAQRPTDNSRRKRHRQPRHLLRQGRRPRTPPRSRQYSHLPRDPRSTPHEPVGQGSRLATCRKRLPVDTAFSLEYAPMNHIATEVRCIEQADQRSTPSTVGARFGAHISTTSYR